MPNTRERIAAADDIDLRRLSALLMPHPSLVFLSTACLWDIDKAKIFCADFLIQNAVHPPYDPLLHQVHFDPLALTYPPFSPPRHVGQCSHA